MKINKQAIYYGLGLFVTTFILLYTGIHFFLGVEIVLNNYLAYLAFSTLLGLVTFILASFKSKIGLIVFTTTYLIAFISMFYTFSQSLDGWQDLIGLLQMMLVLGLGLLFSILLQILTYFKNKHKS